MSLPWLNPGSKVSLPDFEKFKMDSETTIDVLKVGARATSNYLREFYRKKNTAEKNKLGGKRSHFWNREIGGSVNNEKVVGDKAVVVIISSPLLPHKVKGGTITGKRGKGWLTIPLVPQAYDKRAKDIEGLFFITSKKGNLLLVKPDKPSKRQSKKVNPNPKSKIKKGKSATLGLKVERSAAPTAEKSDSGFTPYYLLKKSVTQAPWPNSIPTDEVISQVAMEAIERRFKRLQGRGASGVGPW